MHSGHGSAEPRPPQPPDRTNVRWDSWPAQVKTLADEFRREFSRRFRALRGALRTSLVENDVLGLPATARRANARGDSTDSIDVEATDFQFRRDARKREAFRDWLQTQLDQGVLEQAETAAVRSGRHFTGPYVREAYERGLEFADARLRAANIEPPTGGVEAVLGLPVHEDDLRNIYTRAYSELDGITAAVDQQLSRHLATAYQQGWGSQRTARVMTATVRGIQRTRAATLARTELMRGHAVATTNRYERQGVEQVVLVTHDPCEECRRVEANNPHALADVRGLLPLHPNCRCALAPAP